MPLLASIPSPSSGTLELGPLTIHMYGLMLLLGIAACIAITGRRWVARGGDWDLIFRVAVWGVGVGIVGARLYHVVTSWDQLPDAWWGPLAVWRYVRPRSISYALSRLVVAPVATQCRM